MSLKRSWAALLLLSPALGWATAPTAMQKAAVDEAFLAKPAPPSAGSAPTPPAPTGPGQRRGYLLRLEATTLALLPRHGAGEVAGFVQLEPGLVLDGGEKLGLSLGAPVRLRAWGGADGAGLVREEDWDTPSDWGQWVRFLTLGNESSPGALWAGSLDIYSLLSGHLVRHYSNRSNPDYHPAGRSSLAPWVPCTPRPSPPTCSERGSWARRSKWTWSTSSRDGLGNPGATRWHYPECMTGEGPAVRLGL